MHELETTVTGTYSFCSTNGKKYIGVFNDGTLVRIVRELTEADVYPSLVSVLNTTK